MRPAPAVCQSRVRTAPAGTAVSMPLRTDQANQVLSQIGFAQVPVQLPPAPPDVVNAKIHLDLARVQRRRPVRTTRWAAGSDVRVCIPGRVDLASEVASIDPTVRIYTSSPGRIGCASDEYRCIGSTAQPGFRDVLANLAQLEYVSRIQLSVLE